ncbi:hypothetical protein L2E82_26851 [Cichorium intybus]|uniref:Uncharacterized protein n=1 Tax=Cichorium intybus TaxID=13427 RepID=A0ACB9CRD9_CICIN|nr:hypothetical protein L2E82_26851 [Cichorium intybus]
MRIWVSGRFFWVLRFSLHRFPFPPSAPHLSFTLQLAGLRVNLFSPSSSSPALYPVDCLSDELSVPGAHIFPVLLPLILRFLLHRLLGRRAEKAFMGLYLITLFVTLELAVLAATFNSKAIALLVGNDHDSKGVQGIGIETALSFVKSFNEDEVLERYSFLELHFDHNPSVSTSLALASAFGIMETIALFFGSGLLLNTMGIPVVRFTNERETDLRLPGSFESIEEYLRVFQPLLFEECRAELYSTWEELTETSSKNSHTMDGMMWVHVFVQPTVNRIVSREGMRTSSIALTALAGYTGNDFVRRNIKKLVDIIRGHQLETDLRMGN